MNAVATIPTEAAVEAAWQRYRAVAARVADDPTLLVDRQHCEEIASAWATWRDAYLEWGKKC